MTAPPPGRWPGPDVAPPLPEGMAVALAGIPADDLAELEERYAVGRRAAEVGEAAAYYERTRDLAPDLAVLSARFVADGVDETHASWTATAAGVAVGGAAALPPDPDARLRAFVVLLAAAHVTVWRHVYAQRKETSRHG